MRTGGEVQSEFQASLGYIVNACLNETRAGDIDEW
jgi:hypothetical protein